jgi:hypothetical protein
MSMSVPSDTKEDHGPHGEAADDQRDSTGNSGEGAASALAHMIARGRQQRHEIGEAGDAMGSRHP